MTSLRSASARLAASFSAEQHTTGSRRFNRKRRLIVDTDLGLDDLVALAILRLQQSIQQQAHPVVTNDSNSQYMPFQIDGVTITSGISCANLQNAALLRGLLPPDTTVYVSGNGEDTTSLSWMTEDKPIWWTKTARRVKQFLSSLPPKSQENSLYSDDTITAEQFISNNLDDPNVDFLCMAPLSTIARALQLRSKQHPTANNSSPKATMYIMGGIRSDSRVTKRGDSTASFGYHDIVGEAKGLEANPAAKTKTAVSKRDRFGEFNFALDIESARNVLSSLSTRIIPLEACTLVPKSLPCSATSDTLSSVLSHSKERQCLGAVTTRLSDTEKELNNARRVLFKLLQEYGTTETQWDSITAAIYCNAFGSACVGDSRTNAKLQEVGAGDLKLSDLGVLSFPGCQCHDASGKCMKIDGEHKHWIYPALSVADESTFFRYLSFLLCYNNNY